MNILILTSSNPYKTAGVVALDLYKGLNKYEDNNVKILVGTRGNYGNKDIISVDSKLVHILKKINKKFLKVLKRIGIEEYNENRKVNKNYSVQDYDQTVSYYDTEFLLGKINFKPDRIIVLFMQKFISFKNLYEFNTITNAPVFLYMMDMAPMTGGCHYAWNCLKYIEECGKCPAIFSNIINDQTHINYKFKLKYIQKTNITVIAASEQQALQLESSSLYFSKRKAKILIGVDSFVFNPFSKSDERINFGLPTNKKILFFGAVSVDAKRKGFIQLIEALNHLKEQNPDIGNEIHLAIAGHAGSELIGSLPFNYTSLGSLNHSQLARAFQFSDIFISPSIEDSGPMMINQSIMSGTPVVAFDIGVALDLVKTSETGYLASYGDSIDLSNGIKRILDLEEIDYIRMCKKCRNLGLEKCNPRLQASEFHKIMIS